MLGFMKNPWLDIPLADYEGHMHLPEVAQAQLLADVFEEMLKRYCPSSVAVLGCAGGNGFERIPTTTTKRVVGVDINPDYIQALHLRFHSRIPGLELIVGDIQSEAVRFAPVEFVFAALVLEYVDLAITLRRIRSLLHVAGILGTVVQLPSPASSAVTPSPFTSIQTLAPVMRLVPPDELRESAERAGYRELARHRTQSPGGKQFQLQTFSVG